MYNIFLPFMCFYTVAGLVFKWRGGHTRAYARQPHRRLESEKIPSATNTAAVILHNKKEGKQNGDLFN